MHHYIDHFVWSFFYFWLPQLSRRSFGANKLPDLETPPISYYLFNGLNELSTVLLFFGVFVHFVRFFIIILADIISLLHTCNEPLFFCVAGSQNAAAWFQADYGWHDGASVFLGVLATILINSCIEIWRSARVIV